MSMFGSRSSAAAPGSGSLALSVAFSLGLGACARHAEPPAAVDAAPDRQLVPASFVHDAAAERPVDAQPDVTGPPRPHPHRPAPPAPPAGGGGLKLEGSITKPDAERVLRGVRGKLNACYEEHAQNAALAGRVSFRLSIDSRGRVPLAEVVSSTLGGGDPELCMVEALRDLKFSPSAIGGESTLTFLMPFGR